MYSCVLANMSSASLEKPITARLYCLQVFPWTTWIWQPAWAVSRCLRKYDMPAVVRSCVFTYHDTEMHSVHRINIQACTQAGKCVVCTAVLEKPFTVLHAIKVLHACSERESLLHWCWLQCLLKHVTSACVASVCTGTKTCNSTCMGMSMKSSHFFTTLVSVVCIIKYNNCIISSLVIKAIQSQIICDSPGSCRFDMY